MQKALRRITWPSPAGMKGRGIPVRVHGMLGSVTALLHQYRGALVPKTECRSERPLHAHSRTFPRHPTRLGHYVYRTGPVSHLVGSIPQRAHRTFYLTHDSDGLTVETTRIAEQRLDGCRGFFTADEEECGDRYEQQAHRRPAVVSA